MPSGGFEQATQAREQPQTQALDRTVTGIKSLTWLIPDYQ